MNTPKRTGISRSEYAYQRIRQRLLSGDLRPGDVISTYALAEELDISRTPVTEAIKRLEAENFLEIIPQVGCVVRSPRPDEIQEAFLIRSVLEGLAAELAAQRITDEGIQSLEALLQESEGAAEARDASAYQELNMAFHQRILQLAASPMLEQLVNNLWQRKGYEIGSLPFFGERFAISMREHREIVKQLRARDPRGARDAVEAHIRRSASAFLAFLDSSSAA